MQFAEFLSQNEIEQIHDASLEILETVGVLVNNNNARDIYSRHGCKVDTETAVVKFPRNVVETYRRAFVPEFKFTGRDPKFDRTIQMIVLSSSLEALHRISLIPLPATNGGLHQRILPT